MGKGQELLDGARNGDVQVVEKILAQISRRSGPLTSLRRGAGVNVQDSNGYTPLHHACVRGHREIVRLLLEADASPCLVDRKGASALHLAAWTGDSDIVRMLLAHNTPPVNIDLTTGDHETALLIAAQFGHVDVVAQLLARGADVTVRNNRDESALDVAAQYGRLKTVRHLLHARPQLVDPYRAPGCRHMFPSTPLHRASKNGHREVVAALIDAGVDPNIQTACGTALHEAALCGKESVVSLLLHKGVKLNARDRAGRTVIMLLSEYPEKATQKVREAILRSGPSSSKPYEIEDLPSIPVQDYSPSYENNYSLLRTRRSPSELCDERRVSNASMKPPETQQNTKFFNNKSSANSSSVTKIHPQSFVKKLASKCLGLKAKFNSAPNISNSGLESEVVKSQSNVQMNTNTLLIGNSRFFKRLSKKEESGEINCNDEFDTISLDRLATLERVSVVNRSNRSCPGFKVSLPNISENMELSDSHESNDSVIIVELDECIETKAKNDIVEAINKKAIHDIFEPRKTIEIKGKVKTIYEEAINKVNECYESYDFSSLTSEESSKDTSIIPKPLPRHNLAQINPKDNSVYENVIIGNVVQPKPTARKNSNSLETEVIYENVSHIHEEHIRVTPKPQPPKRSFVQSQNIDDKDIGNQTISNSNASKSSTLSSDSMVDETILEDVLLSKKSYSFKHKKEPKSRSHSIKSSIKRTDSSLSNLSDASDLSAMENVDCSQDFDKNDENLYLSMTGTLPNQNSNKNVKPKALFRHKTFTTVKDHKYSFKRNNSFLKETLAQYHIRGTGHCVYQAPTVKEFLYVFNRDTLYNHNVLPFNVVPKRDSYYETAICFCKPVPPKSHNSAEDLLKISTSSDDGEVIIDTSALQHTVELAATSFRCFCADHSTCTFHTNKRESPSGIVIKFSAIKKSISTPNITLELGNNSLENTLTNTKNIAKLEEPYAVVEVAEIAARSSQFNSLQIDRRRGPITSVTSTLSTTSGRPYSIKDVAEVISLTDEYSSMTEDASLTFGALREPAASAPKLSTSSGFPDIWSLKTCHSNTSTARSDSGSFKSCFDSSDSDAGTLLSDGDSSDDGTIKSDVSVTKRPWVDSDSFKFDIDASQSTGDVINEEESDASKSPSDCGSVEGSNVPGVVGVEGVSLVASLERGRGVRARAVRSGSGRRRWDELEATSEGDALSLSSAASSNAPHHMAHHYELSKVSPTPPKKPPRRNLSVSPTHANSPSSAYSYELRPHARSQDDLDDIQGSKHYLKHGRSVDQYVDGKLSYVEYDERHSPRIAPVPQPRPSLKQRSQPVAITTMCENVVMKEQNPRRKLRRNNFTHQYENFEPVRPTESRSRKCSVESLLDDRSLNTPSDGERGSESSRSYVPSSPTHYDQPPTPDHPPPSARHAENSIHERIRPLSQEYKRRSVVRDRQTETEVVLLRADSSASLASARTDRSGQDYGVEEYVCDVPFAGLFKGSTTTLDGIGLRPTPAERPRTLRKLKSVYDTPPNEPPAHHQPSLLQPPVGTNGIEDVEPRRRSNTSSSTQSADKSLAILSPFDEQEEWAKISEIMASIGTKMVRESVFVAELEQEFTTRLGMSCSECSLSPSVTSSLGLWLSSLGLLDYEPLFMESGFDDVDFINGIIEENDLREMGIEEAHRSKILESTKQLPPKIAEISTNHNNNVISRNQNESVEDWLKIINLEQYSETFRKHLYVDMDRVRRIWEVELTAVLEIQKSGHRKRILASVSGQHNGPINNMEHIHADLNSTKPNVQHIKDGIKISENLKAVPPPTVPTLAPPGGETLKRSKKNRPAPQPPRPSDLEIRAPSELLVGVPGALKTQWKHQPFVLVTGAVTYVANYLGSTVVKELRGTESTKKSIQKLKKSTKEPRDSPDIILSISYRGVKFLNTITRELICEHEIRNIHCACQDADDLTHFAYITKDHTTRSHYCHVFCVATMDQATEVILTLGEAFEVAYQMVLREQSNRSRVQTQAKTPTHDPTTTTSKEKPNMNHGRSHSITEIKLNGHQLKIAPIPASLSNEDFQVSARTTEGSKSPRTPLLKAPMASTEEL